MQTIFSGFQQFTDADAAVQELQERGIEQKALNVLVDAQTAKSNLDSVNQARVHVDVTDAIGVKELTGLALLVMMERRKQRLCGNELRAFYGWAWWPYC